jgi:RNA polymerase sigma-70 factor (ECF subfamily)
VILAIQRTAIETEASVIEACRRGDRDALDSVFRTHAPMLQRLLTRIAGPGPEVEDLLEASLIAALEAFPRFRGEASVERWLASIATRTAYNHFRYAKRRKHASLELVTSQLEPVDARPLPDKAIESRRRMDRLYHHLGRMSASKRIPFVLYFLEGRPLDEVAAMVGSSAALTKGRIFLARRNLLAWAKKDPELQDLFDAEMTP